MSFKQLFIFSLATVSLAASTNSTATQTTGSITAAPVQTTSTSISLLNTATVTCLHEVCMHGLSYCWYWPTMEVGIGSLGADPSFTLAPFATCTEAKYQTQSTLDTVTVTTASAEDDGYEETPTEDCEEEAPTPTGECEEED